MGNGYIAKRHRKAIHALGGDIVAIYDPFKYGYEPYGHLFREVDYTVICSPTDRHWSQIVAALMLMPPNGKVIVEKPMWLPWEPFLDDDRVNVVLQYRFADLQDIKKISVCMVRDAAYLASPKGDFTVSGGFLFNLFIHYIDLAFLHRATFTGRVVSSGDNWRLADSISLADQNLFDQNDLYLKMYKQIAAGNGVKPSALLNLWLHMVSMAGQWGYDDSFMVDGLPLDLEFKGGL